MPRLSIVDSSIMDMVTQALQTGRYMDTKVSRELGMCNSCIKAIATILEQVKLFSVDVLRDCSELAD